jgi:hypothetical protein
MLEAARRWQPLVIEGLDVPDSRFVGAFRGEPGPRAGFGKLLDAFAPIALMPGTAVARANSGHRRRQVQQAPEGANVGTDLTRRYISFIVPLPLQE